MTLPAPTWTTYERRTSTYTQICRVPDCAIFGVDHIYSSKPNRMSMTTAIGDLRQQIHDDLRRQHPEWVLPNGESPMCDAYEARLMDQLALMSGSSYDAEPNSSALHRLG
jgi:hypothetical protein